MYKYEEAKNHREMISSKKVIQFMRHKKSTVWGVHVEEEAAGL